MSSRSGDLVLCVNVVVSIVSCSCFACLQELLNISRLAGSNAAGQNHPLTDLSALHALQLSNEVQLFSCLAYLPYSNTSSTEDGCSLAASFFQELRTWRQDEHLFLFLSL